MVKHSHIKSKITAKILNTVLVYKLNEHICIRLETATTTVRQDGLYDIWNKTDKIIPLKSDLSF